MITVHHLESSRSHRVLWLLEELELPYDIKHYKRDPKTMLAPPEMRDVHPLGKSPIVTDDERTLVESGAILEYLAERHGGGRLLPEAGTPERLRCRQFLHYAEGSLMPLLLLRLVFDRIDGANVPFFVKPVVKTITGRAKGDFIAPQLALHLGYLERELSERPWLAGQELTLADIQMSVPVEAAAARADDFSGRHPSLRAYLERMRSRPAYQRALERGGALELGG